MILDKNLTFVRGKDTPVTTTKAIPLGQKDLTGDTSGMGPYSDFFLQVQAAAAIPSLTVTLEHSDTEAGTYATVVAYPAKANLKAGDIAVKAPVPFAVKNWVRLKFSVAAAVDAFMVCGVDKGVVENE